MNDITFRIIGYVESKVLDPKDENWGETRSRILLKPEYHNGLKGLDLFSHVIVVTYLHKACFESDRHIIRRPRGLDSMPEVGIFAQRAKDRPNPIGITAVPLLALESGAIWVKGLDAVNETPVLDIKPYYPAYDRIMSATVPEWVDRLMQGYF